MGLYIEVPQHRNKAQQILDTWPEARRWDHTEGFDAIPVGFCAVCVVQNGMFDAAGVVFDEKEYRDFLHPDGRLRTWLLVRKEDVMKLPKAKFYFGGE